MFLLDNYLKTILEKEDSFISYVPKMTMVFMWLKYYRWKNILHGILWGL
jgi:hypothetical protein